MSSITVNLKLLDEWLILSAMKKASARYDEWNLNMFKGFLKGKIHNAQRSALNLYLFGNEQGKMIDVADMKKELKTLRQEIKID